MKLFLIICISIPMVSFAESLYQDSDDNSTRIKKAYLTNGGNQNQPENEETPKGTEDIAETGGFGVTNNGGKEYAGKTEDKGGMTQMLGMGMGAAFATQCGPQNTMACVMAAKSFMDALASGKTADSAGYTGMQYDPYSNPYGYKGTNPVYKARNDEIIKKLKDLDDMGYSANADGSVSTPTGTNFSGADLNSVDALVAKGLTAEQANAAVENLKSVKDQAMKNAGMSDSGAGGAEGLGAAGGGQSGLGSAMNGAANGSATDNGYGDGEAGGGLASADNIQAGTNAKGKVGRLPASQAAKLKKDFNGSPIGIGMADLFLIVNQKYTEKKSNKNEFINREY